MSRTPKLALAGRAVLVTGAGSGIGAASAKALADAGANVTLVDLQPAGLKNVADALGPRALALPADVTDKDAMADAAARAVEPFGSLDVVFANAGHVLGLRLLERHGQRALRDVQGRGGELRSLVARRDGRHRHDGRRAVPGLGEHPHHRCLAHQPVHPGADPSAYPGPYAKSVTPERFAEAVVRGVGARSGRIICPRRWIPLSASRGVLNIASDALVDHHRKIQSLVRQVEQ